MRFKGLSIFWIAGAYALMLLATEVAYSQSDAPQLSITVYHTPT